MTERLTRAEWEARLVDERTKAQTCIREDRSRGKERLTAAIEALRAGRTGRGIALLTDLEANWDDGFDVVVSRAPVDQEWKADFFAPLRIELRLGNAWFAHEEAFDVKRQVPLEFIIRHLVRQLMARTESVVFRKACTRAGQMFPEGKLS